MTDHEEVRDALRTIIHAKERRDAEIPPSLHVEIEMECQRVWKALGYENVDALYPEAYTNE